MLLRTLLPLAAGMIALSAHAEPQPRLMGDGKPVLDVELQPSTPVTRAAAEIPTEKVPDLSSTSTMQEAASDLLPMTPHEIREFRLWKDSVEKASKEPVNAPLPRRRTVHLDLSPGANPPIIQVRPSFDTSLTVLDQTGQPWPVTRFASGDDKAYPVKASGPSSIIIKGQAKHAMSNLTLHLEGMRSPMTWTLLYGDDEVDYEVTAIVPMTGPSEDHYDSYGNPVASDPEYVGNNNDGDNLAGNPQRGTQPGTRSQSNGFLHSNPHAKSRPRQQSKQPVFTGYQIPALPEDELVAYLDGSPPDTGVAVPVAGDRRTRAWIQDKKLVVRTPHILASPKPQTQINGDAGYSVFVTDVRPVLVMLVNGSPRHLQLALSRSQLALREDK